MSFLSFLRRRTDPSEHDSRALAVANRRILQLETANVRLQHRVDRLRADHADECELQLEVVDLELQLAEALRGQVQLQTELRDAFEQLQASKQQYTALYRRMRGLADMIRPADTKTMPAAAAAPDQEERRP